jgi:uncharacterized protein
MVIQKRWGKLFLIIILLGFFATHANAASFDCKKAASWVEKTVCSNPELSNLDEEMAKAYHDALANLSLEGQKETKQYQKQWIKESPPGCKDDKQDISIKCLKDSYKNRIKELQHSLIKFPYHIFRNVKVRYQSNDKECPGFGITWLSYPQIENPHNENEKFWNSLIAQKAHNELKIDTECTINDIKYTVDFSNKYIISLTTERSITEYGAGRSFQVTKTLCWLIEVKRALRTSDLFDDKTSWRKKLTVLASPKVKEELKKQIYYADEKNYETEPSRLMEIVTSADHWLIMKDGLGIEFRQHELGSREIPYIEIDWKTLEPYLSKNGKLLLSD